MNYIKLFQDNTEYESDQSNFLHPHVSYIKDDKRVIYEKTAPSHDYSQDYLTFEALEDGTFQLTSGCSYSLDSGSTWTSLASNTSTPTVSAGEKIMFKASIPPDVNSGVGRFSSTGRFNAMGNPYSMLDGDNFADITDLRGFGGYALYGLFLGCTGLTSAENLSLTASLYGYDYTYMFSGCTSLVNAPELPATGAAFHCYDGMFKGCTSLTTAPELPATTLDRYCYQHMFYGCTSLTTAPELPAATLANSCYFGMFYNCTSLNNVKMLATDISANQCLDNWLYGVSATGTFTKNSAMSSLPSGNSGIPTGWTVINN